MAMDVLRFDIRTAISAQEFLTKWLNLESNQIMSYILENSTGVNVDGFVGLFKIDIDSLNVNYIKYIVSHVTTTIDNFDYMKQYGLLDLATLLRMDSPLNRYLKNQGIEFDIDEL